MKTKSGELQKKEYQTGGWKAHWILIVCSLLYMINHMDRTVFAVVMQPMKLELGLSDADLGFAMTLFMLGIVLFSSPVAYLVDRWSRKKSLAIMAVLWSGFTFATGLARNFSTLLFARGFVGVGEAGFSSGGTAMITAAYPKEKHGRVLGIFNLVIPVGMAIGTIIGGIISVKLGWHAAFYIFAVPGIVIGISALFLRDYKTVESDGDTGARGDFIKRVLLILRVPTMRWWFVGYGLLEIPITAMGWNPAFLMRELSVKEDTAGLIAGAIGLMAIVGALLGGWLTDYWHKKDRKGRMYLPALAGLLAGVFLIMAFTLIKVSFIAFLIPGLMLGVCCILGIPALGAVSQEVVPPSCKGLSWGVGMFFMYLLGGAWAPWAVGAISDAIGGGADGLRWAIIMSSIGGFGAAFCFFMGSRSYIADADKVNAAELECER